MTGGSGSAGLVRLEEPTDRPGTRVVVAAALGGAPELLVFLEESPTYYPTCFWRHGAVGLRDARAG